MFYLLDLTEALIQFGESGDRRPVDRFIDAGIDRMTALVEQGDISGFLVIKDAIANAVMKCAGSKKYGDVIPKLLEALKTVDHGRSKLHKIVIHGVQPEGTDDIMFELIAAGYAPYYRDGMSDLVRSFLEL